MSIYYHLFKHLCMSLELFQTIEFQYIFCFSLHNLFQYSHVDMLSPHYHFLVSYLFMWHISSSLVRWHDTVPVPHILFWTAAWCSSYCTFYFQSLLLNVLLIMHMVIFEIAESPNWQKPTYLYACPSPHDSGCVQLLFSHIGLKSKIRNWVEIEFFIWQTFK